MGFLVLNLLNAVMFGIIVGLCFILPYPIPAVLVILWAMWLFYSNYNQLLKSGDFPVRLRRYGRRHGGLFSGEAASLLQSYEGVLSKKVFFEAQTDSVQHAYDIICRRVLFDIESAVLYMSSYDYANRPNTKILTKLVWDAQQMAADMNQLSDLVFKIDQDASQVNIDGLSDFLEALEKISNE